MNASVVALQIALGLGMVAMAVSVLFLRNLMASAVSLAGFSLLLALEFYILQAPDVAIAEAGIGAGLTTAIFMVAIRAVTAKGKKEAPPATPQTQESPKPEPPAESPAPADPPAEEARQDAAGPAEAQAEDASNAPPMDAPAAVAQKDAAPVEGAPAEAPVAEPAESEIPDLKSEIPPPPPPIPPEKEAP